MAAGVSAGVSVDGEEELNSSINTTPLVDVMLVLLIIFLITIPVVVTTIPVQLPVVSNIATTTKPENIVIAVDGKGTIYWNNVVVPDYGQLLVRLKEVALQVPQPEVHIRGDKETRFENIGRVYVTVQRAGILKTAFITEPNLPGSGG